MKTSQLPKKGMAGLKAHFKDDLMAGLVVSLIALPLCLGIASASGVPPLAGVVTAIIGGIFASRVSGTFVTISGPAAGLIVITLGAVESMGAPGSLDGYPHALGAIVIGGLIMAVFGLLKVGKVGDYFPSAAVHGMLAAIGVIIMIKLLFPALGVPKPKGEILEVATEIPHALTHFNINALYITLITLATLIVHPMIKSKIIKIIPAPMWVLIFTIPLAFYLGHEHLDMVNLDGGLLGGGGLQLPSFEKIGTSPFWVAVVGVALVSAIESLLSAKAVDSLDPYKRTSNLDKDLMSMGAGSSLAATLGGLPMISEIVRSSANVNNGAKTQWANFYHGIFLLIYVLIGVTVIEMIPNAALAAMLVFTGFRLAHPKEFVHMAKIGIAEIVVFIITLIAVLATDLIIGIVIGIIATYVFVIIKGNPIGNLFKAKGDVIKNELKLTGFLTFSNYLSLKKKMDAILKDNDTLILNYENVDFIDHTVIHHIEDYERNAILIGKKVNQINLEGLNPISAHPLAARDRKNTKTYQVNLTARNEKLKTFASANNYGFDDAIEDFKDWHFYNLSIRRKINAINNVMIFSEAGLTYKIADMIIQQGAQATVDVDKVTVIKITGVKNIPNFYMHKTYLTDRIKESLGNEDINFDSHPKFSDKYVLRSDTDEKEVRAFFNPELLSFLEQFDDSYLSGNGKDLLFHFGEKLLEPKDIETLIRSSKLIVKKVK